MARGEEVGPEEPDPTHEPEVGVLGLMKFLVYVLLFIICTGKFVTGDWMWGYDSKWLRVKTYFPVRMRHLAHLTLTDLYSRSKKDSSQKAFWLNLTAQRSSYRSTLLCAVIPLSRQPPISSRDKYRSTEMFMMCPAIAEYTAPAAHIITCMRR